MSITVDRKPAVIHDVLAYDLEWRPDTLQLRCANVYDGLEHRTYLTIPEMLAGELRPETAGRRYYAHAGGLYDVQYVLDEIVSRPSSGLTASCVFSSASAIIVEISDGERSWTFVDSFWTLRGSLKDIGHSIGHEKTECDFYAPIEQLIPYCRNDSEILWEALQRAQAELLELGGQLQPTLASSALRLFRRRDLESDIRTNAAINRRLRPWYAGGRVEPIGRTAEKGAYYDLNSAFPWAMRVSPLPGALIGWRKDWRERALSFVHAEVFVPPDCPLPVLPWRSDSGGLYFPTGKWQGWFAGEELAYAVSIGFARIVKVIESYEFEPRMDARTYVDRLYDLRKATEDPYRKDLLKLCLNGLYGKMAEESDKTKILIHPTTHQLAQYPVRELLTPGVWSVGESVRVPHTHIPFAATVTARARVRLHQHMLGVLVAGGVLYYCDTDGFATNLLDIPTDAKLLGALKLEKTFDSAMFPAPKIYMIQSHGKDPLIRAKGMPRKLHRPDGSETPLTPQDFEAIVVGRPIPIARMSRLRGLYRGGGSAPSIVHEERAWTDSARPKRAWTEDGGSRPWSIAELGDPWIEEGPRVKRKRPEVARVPARWWTWEQILDHNPNAIQGNWIAAEGAYRTWRREVEQRDRERRAGLRVGPVPARPVYAGQEGDGLADYLGGPRIACLSEAWRRVLARHPRTPGGLIGAIGVMAELVPDLGGLLPPDEVTGLLADAIGAQQQIELETEWETEAGELAELLAERGLV